MSGLEREARRRRRSERLAIGVLLIGLLQFAGHFSGIRALRGLGAVSGAAPFPKVFTAHRGVETFAWTLTLCYRTQEGQTREVLTPARCAQLRGPYNRRNVYGAVLSYGPLLPRELRASVARAALGPQGSLRAELGLPERARELRIELRSRTPGDGRVWILHEDGSLTGPPVSGSAGEAPRSGGAQ